MAVADHVARRRGEYAVANFLRRGSSCAECKEYGFQHTLCVTIGTDKENRAVLDALTTFMGANSESRG